MDQNQYLDDLLARVGNDNLRPGLSLPEGITFQSDLTISYQARAEVKELRDPALIVPLQNRLESEKDTERRIDLFWVLTKLADNVQEHAVADYVLRLLRKEKIRWVKDSALRNLLLSSLIVEQEQHLLFEFATDKAWQIRQTALQLLRKLDHSYSARIEAICLSLIEASKNKPYELENSCLVLAKHGTLAALPALKTIAQTNNKAFLLNAALQAIASINGAQELPFFLTMFASTKNNEVKSTLSELLCRFGDSTVTGLLADRARTILARERKTSVIYAGGAQPELVHILTFLKNGYPDQFIALATFIKSKKLNFLDETERAWLLQETNT